MSTIETDRLVNDHSIIASFRGGTSFKRVALIGALLSISVAGVAWSQTQAPAPVGTAVATDIITQLQAATTPQQVNDIIAAASVGMTPDQIGQLVSAAVAAHPTFALSIVSAASAAHPEAVNQIALAAINALPVGQQAAASAGIVAAAARGAGVSIASVATSVAANNANVGSASNLASAAQNAGLVQLAGNAPQPAARDSLSSFTPTGNGDQAPPIGGTTIVPDSTAAEPPATDPSKGNSGSPS